jgi:hypothetical protein
MQERSEPLFRIPRPHRLLKFWIILHSTSCAPLQLVL